MNVSTALLDEGMMLPLNAWGMACPPPFGGLGLKFLRRMGLDCGAPLRHRPTHDRYAYS
jgi:hypothetical protein